jgi:Zn-dependent protease with chaperone function
MSADPYSLGGSFSGRLRGKGVQEGGVEARLVVGPDGLRVEVEPEARLPFDGMKLRRDDGGALICASGGYSVTCLDPEFERALETAGGNDLNDQLARLAGQKASSKFQHRSTCLVTLIAALAFLYFLPAMFRGCSAKVAEQTPYELDEEIGELAHEQMETDSRVVEDPLVVGAIQTMVNRLAPHVTISDYPDRRIHFTVRVVESELVNAYALPGGFITVYSGLIAEADRPEQVAAVLAHEIAHVSERHGIDRVVNAALAKGAVLVLGGDYTEFLSVLTDLDQLAYGRGQESQADEVGVALMVDANLDPIAMAEFFELLRDKYGDQAADLGWLSTHPSHATRIDEIRSMALLANRDRDGRDWDALELDWEAVQAALDE